MRDIRIITKFGNVTITEGSSFAVKSTKCKTKTVKNVMEIRGKYNPLEIVLSAGKYGSLFIRTDGGNIDVNLPNCVFETVDTKSGIGKSNIVLNCSDLGPEPTNIVSSSVTKIMNSSFDGSVSSSVSDKIVDKHLSMNKDALLSDYF